MISEQSVQTQILEQTYLALRKASNVCASMTRLAVELRGLRQELSLDEWEEFRQICIDHPLAALIHQDPFTYRAFAKPRGYAGDARMLDFIYQESAIQEELTGASELGKEIYEYTSNTPASKAVRERRNIAKHLIDEVATEVYRPRILSIACGHLNEAKYARSVQDGCIDKFVALDQDPKSLSVVADSFADHPCILPTAGSVRQILKQQVELGDFDLIYALGLYDYLPQSVAQRLTSVMFSMLRPGGRLLIGNFVPHIRDVGYMEVFMDWRLIYRTPEEMLELSANIDDSGVDKRVFTESNKNVVFLDIQKR